MMYNNSKLKNITQPFGEVIRDRINLLRSQKIEIYRESSYSGKIRFYSILISKNDSIKRIIQKLSKDEVKIDLLPFHSDQVELILYSDNNTIDVSIAQLNNLKNTLLDLIKKHNNKINKSLDKLID